VLPPPARLVLVAPDPESAEVARAQLAEGGYEVADVVGSDAVPADASLDEIAVSELARLAADGGAAVIDVREPEEWATGHVPGALLISLGRLRDELDRVPRSRRAIVICEAGVRSCTAASLLLAQRADVAHVPAGTSGYRRAGLPLEFTPAEPRP
jgi:rhodanese-related sulfurtransferase